MRLCCAQQNHQVNGLVHISQLADEFVANCDDHVKEGDMVRQERGGWPLRWGIFTRKRHGRMLGHALSRKDLFNGMRADRLSTEYGKCTSVDNLAF